MVDFDEWDGSSEGGIPYVGNKTGLHATLEKDGKDEKLDWIERVAPLDVLNKWIQVEKMALINSFEDSKALVYCIRYNVKDKDGNKIEKRGHLYSTVYLDTMKQYKEGTLFYLDMRPVTEKMMAIQSLDAENISDVNKAKPVDNPRDISNR
jgi:hypothetical protein